MIALVATKAFTHNGLSLHPGDRLEVRPIEAAALTYQQKAVFEHQYSTRHLIAETSTPKRKRRAYRRRDLVADNS